jgi:hypothetical protein
MDSKAAFVGGLFDVDRAYLGCALSESAIVKNLGSVRGEAVSSGTQDQSEIFRKNPGIRRARCVCPLDNREANENLLTE